MIGAPGTGGDWPADVAAPGGWGSAVERPYRPGETVGDPIGVSALGELVYAYSYGTRLGDTRYKNPLTGDYTTWARPVGYSGPDIPLVESAGATPPSGGAPSAMLSPATAARFVGGTSTPPDIIPFPTGQMIGAIAPLAPQSGAPSGGVIAVAPPSPVAPAAFPFSTRTVLVVLGGLGLGWFLLHRRRTV